jgi:hypothetical protein
MLNSLHSDIVTTREERLVAELVDCENPLHTCAFLGFVFGYQKAKDFWLTREQGGVSTSIFTIHMGDVQGLRVPAHHRW